MDKVYTVKVEKTLIIQASSDKEARDKAFYMSDSDSLIHLPDQILDKSGLPKGVEMNDMPDNSMGLTIEDVISGEF